MTAFDGIFISIAVACLIALVTVLVSNKTLVGFLIWLAVSIFIIGATIILMYKLHWESSIFGTKSAEVPTETIGSPIPTKSIDDSDDMHTYYLALESSDDNCIQEGHERVQTIDELKGFYFIESKQSDYLIFMHAISGTTERVYPTVDIPLHHVILDLSARDFSGMEIDISIKGDTSSFLLDRAVIEDNIYEFYISEGKYTVEAEIQTGDGQYFVCYSMTVVIDHCGTYYIK